MNKTARYYNFVYRLGILMLFFTACGPKSGPHFTTPVDEIIYEEETTVPTVNVPDITALNSVHYQPLAKKIINTSNAKVPVEIILGEVELQDAKVSYNSSERKMRITGNVVILNNQKEKLATKLFSLNGAHNNDQTIFILKDDNSADITKNKIAVSAQANCLNLTRHNTIDCNHVMIDVFILYKNKYYTEQIEMNRVKPALNPAPELPQSSPPKPQEISVQNENEDQAYEQQPEDSDDSINGRYQGSAETIDLEMLFPEQETNHKKETTIIPDLKQIKNGEIRPVNQALGFPDKGRLRNATSLLTRQQTLSNKAYFEVVAPDRKKHFTTYEMTELITRISEQLNKKFTKTLYVSNLSAVNGGKLTQHASHQNGLDVDLAYPTDIKHLKFPLVVRKNTGEYFPNNYSVEKTYHLMKFLFTQKEIPIERIFIDQKIKKDLCRYAAEKNELTGENKHLISEMFENLQHVAGHGDHFHLRIKCSKADPACRSRIYRKMETCGNQLALSRNAFTVK